MARKKVVIVGGGFGGLETAKALKNTDFDITIVDRTNHHLFQPLLYQVAAAALSPADIAVPIRSVFSHDKNIKVFMSEALEIDKKNNIVKLSDMNLPFDYLIIATGSKHSYFGNAQWEKNAPGLKTLSDALQIREGIFASLEEAEKLNDKNEIAKCLTYVIIGGGPTGVELAGAISEIVKRRVMKDYRNVSEMETRIYLVELLPRLLAAYPEDLSEIAKKYLEKMGVKVLLNTKVTEVVKDKIIMGDKIIEAKNIIWAAGNEASKLIKSLNINLDRGGRAIVNPDCSIEGNPNIFVIGDAASLKDEKGNPLPAVAPVAIQQGKYVANILKKNIQSSERKKFVYNDKGSMATIGRAKAVAVVKGLKLTGLTAWLAWSLIHVFSLIGYRNRFRVMAEWVWYYFSLKHGIRLIVGRKDLDLA
jgi:NADH:ubiquinone reductase (H+-translocating)